jgi:hypothetical protein
MRKRLVLFKSIVTRTPTYLDFGRKLIVPLMRSELSRLRKLGVSRRHLPLRSHGFLLPSGLYLNYPDLQKDQDEQYSYASRRGRIKIYGGKVVENVCQALLVALLVSRCYVLAKKLQGCLNGTRCRYVCGT